MEKLEKDINEKLNKIEKTIEELNALLKQYLKEI